MMLHDIRDRDKVHRYRAAYNSIIEEQIFVECLAVKKAFDR